MTIVIEPDYADIQSTNEGNLLLVKDSLDDNYALIQLDKTLLTSPETAEMEAFNEYGIAGKRWSIWPLKYPRGNSQGTIRL